MSRRRPTSDRPASSRDAHSRVPSRYGERHVRTVDSEQQRPVSLASLVGKDRRDSPAVQLDGGKRESGGVVGALIAVSNAAGGKGPNFGHAGSGGTRKDMAGTSPAQLPRGPPSCPRRRATTPEPAMGCGHAARGSVFPRPVRPHLQKWRSMGGVGAGPSRSWGGGGGRCSDHRRRGGGPPCPHVGQVVGAAAHRLLLPAALATPAVHEACPGEDQGLTGPSQVGMERPAVIGRLNLFPRGWGGSFRTAIAANNFVEMDRSVAWRLERLLIKSVAATCGRARRTNGRAFGSTTRACTSS